MRHGSMLNPPNRFERVRTDPDLADVQWDQEYLNGLGRRKIDYSTDASQSIISENNSPDLPFRYSINPYRGCVHGCSYCYARNTHEFLGLNAGLDFETKIIVKHDAPDLLRAYLERSKWKCEPIVFSGVTDCYQPAEREYRLTRGCLQVALDHRQPVSIVTKNALVVRDLDLLEPMAKNGLAHVYLSINSIDSKLAREMEPRTSTPTARLRAVRELTDAGVPTGVMVSPIVPGLNDSEIPQVLSAVKDAGAQTVRYILLRLPLTVAPVFEEWLRRSQPEKAEKVLGLIRQIRDGKLNSSEFGDRMRGSGVIAEQIRAMFNMFATKYGFAKCLPEHDCSRFKVPKPTSGQLHLF